MNQPKTEKQEREPYQPRTPEETAKLPPWLLELERRNSEALTEMLSELGADEEDTDGRH